MGQVGKCYCYCSKQTRLGILGLVIAAVAIGTVLIIVFTLDTSTAKIACTDDTFKKGVNSEECVKHFGDKFNNTIEIAMCKKIPATASTKLSFECIKKFKDGRCKEDKDCKPSNKCKNLRDTKCKCSRNLTCEIVSLDQ